MNRAYSNRIFVETELAYPFFRGVVLELGRNYDLHFVTNDGDFFEDKNRTELNHKLKNECDKNDITIRVYSDLELCLKDLNSEAPDPDYQLIANKIHELIVDELSNHASKNNIRVTSIKEKSITALITEDHDQLAIQFDIIFDAMDVGSSDEEKKINPFIHASGDCLFLVSTKKTLDANLNRMEVHWENITGGKKQASTVYLRAAHIFSGNPPAIPHTVRKKI